MLNYVCIHSDHISAFKYRIIIKMLNSHQMTAIKSLSLLNFSSRVHDLMKNFIY